MSRQPEQARPRSLGGEPGPSSAPLRVQLPQLPEGLSLTQTGLAAHIRSTLSASPTSLPGRPGHMSPIGDTGPSPRSDCVAAMDMLNDMFQRQARRLESQLYQRAQDARMIESAHKQAQETMHQVRSLERYHVDQAARIRQGTKAIEELQQQMRAATKEHELVLSTCEALSDDVDKLKSSLLCADPAELETLVLAADSQSLPSVAALRERASSLEASVCEAERTASMHIAATPSTTIAMSSACNPLHDLSAMASFAHRSAESPRSAATAPSTSSSATRRRSCSPRASRTTSP